MSEANINPEHYKGNKLECIDCIEECTRNLVGIEAITAAFVSVLVFTSRYCSTSDILTPDLLVTIYS